MPVRGSNLQNQDIDLHKNGSRSVLLYDGDVILAIKIIVKSAGTILMD